MRETQTCVSSYCFEYSNAWSSLVQGKKITALSLRQGSKIYMFVSWTGSGFRWVSWTPLPEFLLNTRTPPSPLSPFLPPPPPPHTHTHTRGSWTLFTLFGGPTWAKGCSRRHWQPGTGGKSPIIWILGRTESLVILNQLRIWQPFSETNSPPNRPHAAILTDNRWKIMVCYHQFLSA